MSSSASRWVDPSFRAEADSWIRERLHDLGRAVVGEIEQPHVYPWSTAMRVGTDGDDVWFKANGAGTAYEIGIYSVLSAHKVRRILRPLAVDESRGWLLLPDGGPTLRSHMGEPYDIQAWTSMLTEYALLQQDVVPLAEPLVNAGVPDQRPSVLAERYEELLDDTDALFIGRDGGLTASEHERLRELVPDVRTWCEELGASGIPATIQHDDLHSANVFARGPVFFDWGDASVAHPFTTLNTTMRSVAHHHHVAPRGRELAALRDSYLAAWPGDLRVLREVAAVAMRTACISRALAWRRALLTAPADERAPYADSVPGWLDELFADLPV